MLELEGGQDSGPSVRHDRQVSSCCIEPLSTVQLYLYRVKWRSTTVDMGTCGGFGGLYA